MAYYLLVESALFLGVHLCQILLSKDVFLCFLRKCQCILHHEYIFQKLLSFFIYALCNIVVYGILDPESTHSICHIFRNKVYNEAKGHKLSKDTKSPT